MSTREAFDAAVASSDIQWLFENTFLARVPELVAGGMSFDEAIKTAKEREDALCVMMVVPNTRREREAAAELRHAMLVRAYRQANETREDASTP